VLRDFEFRKSMMTEDVDVSCRAILSNRNIAFCPQARSGELCPSSFISFYRQRLRWAVGWDQVTISCLKVMWKAKLSCRRKFGAFVMFPLRWATITIAFFLAIWTPVLARFHLLMGMASP
jgi:cellulose synthase/poly-beta-1,6-N-acetylglucosamine synthase-like glycosyltransferase